MITCGLEILKREIHHHYVLKCSKCISMNTLKYLPCYFLLGDTSAVLMFSTVIHSNWCFISIIHHLEMAHDSESVWWKKYILVINFSNWKFLNPNYWCKLSVKKYQMFKFKSWSLVSSLEFLVEHIYFSYLSPYWEI